MKLNYIKVGDYLLPNLVTNNEIGIINKYGYLRLTYLKEHKKVLYTLLIFKGELTSHLVSVSNEAETKVNFLIECYKEMDKLTEKKKENNQMEWVKMMNNYKNMAEEVVLNEIIYN